ncbi:hypothetical protein E2C01_020775 [Portunus trituberculatus]|uniref:Uncharacterized protein n=1 Tax=Portunus trituberculatus TaxID=210409 RepID=A0A5B7E0T0_PORTR|nr:hypothetical protein [Portunus trituberculatus]
MFSRRSMNSLRLCYSGFQYCPAEEGKSIDAMTLRPSHAPILLTFYSPVLRATLPYSPRTLCGAGCYM